jgi:hypothetical protein
MHADIPYYTAWHTGNFFKEVLTHMHVYIKYKRLKLGGGQAYDHSSNQAAVVA